MKLFGKSGDSKAVIFIGESRKPHVNISKIRVQNNPEKTLNFPLRLIPQLRASLTKWKEYFLTELDY